MSETEWGPIRSFHIDNGELDGLRPQEIFVLGYELAQIDDAVTRPAAIEKPVHAHNRERIVEAFEKAERPYKLSWMNDDVSESWLWLSSPPLQRTETTEEDHSA